MKILTLSRTLLALGMSLAANLLGGVHAHADNIGELSTVFYGKVWGTGGGRPFLITEGTMVWTIRKADGSDVVFRTSLFPLHRGEYSYRLDVPHQALASGLIPSDSVVPLGAAEERHAHLQITIDGLEATILGPGGELFGVNQLRRARTHRLDLEVPLTPPDSDGDGLPDWWEERFGVDDPDGDPDGDGINNRGEYEDHSNPNRDDRVPHLVTRVLRVFAEGTSLVRLRARDSDSGPEELTYTLLATPDQGEILLRNASTVTDEPDQLLAPGDTFTQQDVNDGRLVFQHLPPDNPDPANPPVRRTVLEISLQDEDPEHAVSNHEVVLNIYHPGRPLSSLAHFREILRSEDLRLFSRRERSWAVGYLLSRSHGFIVGDDYGQEGVIRMRAPSSGMDAGSYQSQYLLAFGTDRSHVLIGGSSDDELEGGMEEDVLFGGGGNDRLRGHGGSDLFIVEGSDTIEDFDPGSQDAIDLSPMLTGSSTRLSDYVRLASAGPHTLIEIDADGQGGLYDDAVVTLENSSLAQADLFDLVEQGILETGDKVLPARISIAASVPVASENGPENGLFTLTRSGSLEDTITVNLLISGSAGNGSDYAWLESQVVLLPGQASHDLVIEPYADALSELNEVVDVMVQGGVGYELSAGNRAQVIIEDLAPNFSIETLEGLAIKSTLQPAFILISRSGMIDRSVLLRLDIGGSASTGFDYDALPSFVQFDAGQTTLLLPVTPRASAVLTGGSESVSVSIRPDASYRVGAPEQAQVHIVEATMSFVEWQQTHFPGVTADPLTFSEGDEGSRGFRNLIRYAYQLDPQDPGQSPDLLPRFDIDQDRFSVVFRRHPAIRDLDYVVEVSDDMNQWESGEPHLETYVPIDMSGDLGVVGFRSRDQVSQTPTKFMRIRVIYQP